MREALLNAPVHRDDAVQAPVQIGVYDDTLVIVNPATLPEGWSVSTLRSPHYSHPYNPDIAQCSVQVKSRHGAVVYIESTVPAIAQGIPSQSFAMKPMHCGLSFHSVVPTSTLFVIQIGTIVSGKSPGKSFLYSVMPSAR
jgi:hypothetical protein